MPGDERSNEITAIPKLLGMARSMPTASGTSIVPSVSGRYLDKRFDGTHIGLGAGYI